jgi:hypothetical protein
MDLPSTRIREVLGVLRDLKPNEARALLGQVVATLDEAELVALRKQLTVQAPALLAAGAPVELSRYAGASVQRLSDAATVMNTAPMPWELDPPGTTPPAPEPVKLTEPLKPARVSEAGIETGKIIRQAVPPAPARLYAVIGALAAVVIALVVALIFVPGEEPEVERPRPQVVRKPLPSTAAPSRVVQPVAAPAPAPVKPAAPKPKKKVTARKPAPSADWASPFDSRN